MSSQFQEPYAADQTSLKFFMDVIGSSLREGARAGARIALPAMINWHDIEHIARMNKLFSAMDQGFARNEIEPDEQFKKSSADYKRKSLFLNGKNLTTISHIAKIMSSKKIDFVIFKGPLQQHELYGNYFDRPSSDIDILVPRAAYQQAAACLQEIGYKLPDECNSPWWYHFLGEQHFFPKSSGSAVVDLHHKVQQPGSPGPRHLDIYISSARLKNVGPAAVPVLSAANSTLLSTISFTKAMVRREPAGGYLRDFSASILTMSEMDRLALDDEARHQGLSNTLKFSLFCAENLFSLYNISHKKEESKYLKTAIPFLREMVFTPRDPNIIWPRVRHFLWELTDSFGIGKLGNYAIYSADQLASELCRKWYHSADASH